ncbi:MAG: polymer-forming cytoskeletal protein [Pseudomonadota bacterium]|jgi:cytoskeletal protein CcmA (bactofilin family)
MVWRKRKQQLTEAVSDQSRNDLTKSDLVKQGPDGLQTTGEAVERVASAGSLSPRNLDAATSAWSPDTREFFLPVHHRASQRPYVLPRNYRISGDLSSDRQVLVEGEFLTGTLEAPTVTVATGGTVRGVVKALNVQVAGTVDANVNATQGVEVSGRGRLSGEIRTPTVKVAPGAVLHASKMFVG